MQKPAAFYRKPDFALNLIMPNKIEIKNKKAEFEFFLLEVFSAGIILQGTEVKAIRVGKANLNDAYCAFEGKQLFIKNMHISEYSHGNLNNHEPKRDRKLLLKKTELNKLDRKVKEKGLTIVPVLLYINEKGLVKIDIALAKGKKSYDKRETLKNRDARIEMDRQRYNE